MENIIQLLPDHVANQIAAGEVIQRPASVVKELLENSIDAKSTEITLVVKDAGKSLIQVIDNGIGMSHYDAKLSFQRHATSKIKKAEDLFSLHTKGFRGEALASIAAIARVEMKTKRKSDEVGVLIRIEGNQITQNQPCTTFNGTSFSVKSLFFNIPARRNFLKSDTIELRHIIDEFHRVALAHPDIHFHFYNQDSEIFNLPPDNFRKRIIQLFGRKLDHALIPVEENTDIVKINGYILKPEYLRKSKQLQFFIVNQRFIKNRYLHHAITSAYEGLILPQMQPEYFLNIEVNPKTIDINIHPTKTEVKFENEHHIYSILKSVIRYALGQFNAFPSLDFTKDPSLELPYSYKDKTPVFPKIEVDPTFNPFKKDSSKSFSYPNKKNTQKNLYIGLLDDTHTQGNHIFEEQEQENTLLPYLAPSEENIPSFMLGNRFLVCPKDGNLLIIHIQRAHQRILYERYMKSISSENSVSQQLLFPIHIEFSVSDLIILKSLDDTLFSIGFLISFEEGKIIISGIPIYINENQVEHILHSLIEDCRENIPQETKFQNEFLAKSICKNLSFNSSHCLSQEEQQMLIKDLWKEGLPEMSPFQKKIYTVIPINEIERKIHSI